jgi:hypothetical protein
MGFGLEGEYEYEYEYEYTGMVTRPVYLDDSGRDTGRSDHSINTTIWICRNTHCSLLIHIRIQSDSIRSCLLDCHGTSASTRDCRFWRCWRVW